MAAKKIIRNQLGLENDKGYYQGVDIEDIEIIMEAYSTQVLADIKKEINKERQPLFNKPPVKGDANPNYTAGELQGRVTAHDKDLSIIDNHIKL